MAELGTEVSEGQRRAVRKSSMLPSIASLVCKSLQWEVIWGFFHHIDTSLLYVQCRLCILMIHTPDLIKHIWSSSDF